MFAEAIDVITAIWERDPPYDIDLPGQPLQGHHRHDARPTTSASASCRKPLQSPRPEIVGTVVAPFSKGVIAMGSEDFHPLSANFLLPQWVATHWPNYVEGKESVGAVASTRRLAGRAHRLRRRRRRGGRSAYGRGDANSPYRFYYAQMLDEDAQARPARAVQDLPRRSPTTRSRSTACSTSWSSPARPTQVAEQLLAFREETGEFGELVYAGLDWVDPDAGQRSMELMADEGHAAGQRRARPGDRRDRPDRLPLAAEERAQTDAQREALGRITRRTARRARRPVRRRCCAARS